MTQTHESCIPLEQLTSIAEAPAGSAERAHLDACPRCQAQLLALRAFVAPSTLPAQARSSEAEAELDRFIDQLTAEPEPQTQRRIAAAPAFPWWKRWFSPGPRLVLSAAMVAVVVAGTWMAQLPAGERAVTRGGTMGTSDAGGVTTSDAALKSDGWVLEWQPVADATGYEVLLLGADLAERARFDAGTATQLSLSLSALPAGVDAGEALAWQVEARRGTDVVARSSVAELPRR